MHTWIPTEHSTKGRLVRRALEAFGQRGFDGVAVGELARSAGTTTGALYHHFGSKVALYALVRADAERRVVDRMEGAAEATSAAGGHAAEAALLIGFDHAVRVGFARLLGERHPEGGYDAIEAALAKVLGSGRAGLAPILAAAWRAALLLVAEGDAQARVRQDLEAICILPAGPRGKAVD